MAIRLFYATLLVAVSVAFAYNWYFTYDYVLVDIDEGTLRGFNTTSWRGSKFFAFKGIPYAKPPIGKLRFKAPDEEMAWTGVRDAVSHGSICPQLFVFGGFLRGDEDCLFLNVYTPSLQGERLPVMVWIHGGAFFLGSGNEEEHAPDYLIEAGVIVVTINYRLGALGFLSTGDDGAPGNAGLKDQVAALKWVKRNIAKFGGDPDNVTIFGESAGSVSVHYHILSPMSSGLFARAISQSGSALSTWPLSDDPVGRTVRLAEALQGKDLANDTAKALEFLKTAPYEDIVKASGRSLLNELEERTMTLFIFKPSIETRVESEERFFPDSPLNILESGNFTKVPYIIGVNDKEGYLSLTSLMKPKDEFGAFNDTERYVPNHIKNEELRDDLAKSIREFYFKDKPIGNENISNLIDLYSDIHFVAPTRRATELHLRSSQTPIYSYVFTHDGGLNRIKNVFGIKLPGACHGDEIGYLFYSKLLFWEKPVIGSEDEVVLNTMTRLWTNFAKYGNPTPNGDSLTWKPVTLEEFNYLNISGWETQLSVNPYPERNNFWTKAYEKDFSLRH